MDYEDISVDELAREIENMRMHFSLDGIALAFKAALSAEEIALLIERLSI